MGQNELLLHVDYDRETTQGVIAGKYDQAHHWVTQDNFPTVEKGIQDTTVTLLPFNDFFGKDEALEELDREGFRPANNDDLLALGEQFPDVQRGRPIIQVGTIFKHECGCLYVTVLYTKGRERRLGVRWAEDDFQGPCYVLAIRKEAPTK